MHYYNPKDSNIFQPHQETNKYLSSKTIADPDIPSNQLNLGIEGERIKNYVS